MTARTADVRILEAWGLPPAAAEAVQRLLKSLERGDTALRLSPQEIAAMQGCAAVGDGAGPSPLVLGSGGLLQSWRFREAERAVALRLKALAAEPDRPVSPEASEWLARLYPSASGRDQVQAIALGLRRRLTIISGGPGTGKTRTAAWLLALHLLQRPGLRCVLAAPTGKAARRLGASIAGAALSGDLARVRPQLQAMGARAKTVHGLLAWRPDEDRCGRNALRPLALDLLIVDEASMMDVLQWRALLAALPEGASLVVLGDPFQLQSVEAGRVLGALLESAERGPLAGSQAVLGENFRSADAPGIAVLAAAVRAADYAAILAASPPSALGASSGAEGLRGGKVEEALDRIWPQVLALASATGAEAALRASQDLRILCAVNDGPWGVDGLNRLVELRLRRWAEAAGRVSWCRPLLIQANDPQCGLANGDLGVLVPSPEGERAHFELGGGVKSFAPAQLPAHGTAWAMSVHRSQGSEYGTVLALLPPGHAMTGPIRELVSPELLYTAVTRAVHRVILCADAQALGVVCEPRSPRCTALSQWLV